MVSTRGFDATEDGAVGTQVCLELAADIEKRLDVAVECLAMDDVRKAELYERPSEPTLPTVPTLYEVRLGEGGGIGAALR